MPHCLRRACHYALCMLVLVFGAGCVSTHLQSKRLDAAPIQLNKVLVVFLRHNMQSAAAQGMYASTSAQLANESIGKLAPHIAREVAHVFGLNGLDAQTPQHDTITSEDAVWLADAPMVLVLRPVRASYSPQTGQTLTLGVSLHDTREKKVVWFSEVLFATLGFGSFDDKLSADLGVRLLERMREDGVAQLPQGPLRRREEVTVKPTLAPASAPK